MRICTTLFAHFLFLVFSFCGFAQTRQIVKTSRQVPFGSVMFSDGIRDFNANPDGFIDGYVTKAGNTPFIFPVGHNGAYRPFAADGNLTSGAYFKENPQSASLPQGAPFGAGMEQSVKKVSNAEFWDINGDNDGRITLTWNEQSAVGALTENALNLLTIVGWNNAANRWENIASNIDNTSILGGSSTINSGSITSSAPIKPNNYGVFTLGALNKPNIVSAYEGSFESASCTELKGWVWDKNYSATELTVELFEGDNIYASTKANIYRDDLKNAGVGTGKYGFSLKVPASLLGDNQQHQLSIRVSNSNFVLSGSPRQLTCSFDGRFDVTDCYSLSGWVLDRNNPNSSLDVDIIEKGAVLLTTKADRVRQEVGDVNGNHGFSVVIPLSLRDGKPHMIEVKAKQSGYTLIGSPQNISCPVPQFKGSFEFADCKTISGWAWDKNNPYSTLTVQIMEGANVVAEAIAGDYRSYVKDAGYGTGKYGFSVAVPENLKNGSPHILTVRVKGSETLITGTKTVNCTVNQYSGAFEFADCNTISGWAWDKANPNATVTVQIMDGANVVGEAIANQYRYYLKDAGYGTGNYGFSVALPAGLKDGNAHALTVRIKGSTTYISGTRNITCTNSLYKGSFESATCDLLSGWAWDVYNPGSAVTVQIMEGNTVLAEALANQYRYYLKDAGYGTGNYGFSVAMPTSLKDGKQHNLSVRVKGSGTLITGTRNVTCSNSLFKGSFESATCDLLSGWAWDVLNPGVALTVQIMEGNTVVAEALANQYRYYLKDAGYGTGNYGFSVALPAALKDGNSHTLTVRVKGSTTNITGTRNITCSNNLYKGSLESASCELISGWAWDKNNPNATVTVQILEGSVVIAEVLANEYRYYLKDAGYGTGNYGFSIPTPVSLKNGTPRAITARVKGSSVMLTGTKTVTCASNLYKGSFEYADCGMISGWAWDQKNPGTALTIEILDAGVVVAEATASQYRYYLKDAGYGTGNYGFTLDLPAGLKDGKSHLLTARVKGSTTLLSGSKTVTCATSARITSGQYTEEEEDIEVATREKEPENIAFELTVSPNPTAGQVKVRFNLTDNEKVKLYVIDVAGRTLWQDASIGGQGLKEIEIDLKHKPDGIYLVKLELGNNKIYTKRLVLVK